MKTSSVFLWLAVAVSGVSIPAPAQPRIARSVLGSGGTDAAGASYHIRGTVGQPLIGIARNASAQEFLGFWYTPENVPVRVEAIGGEVPSACAIEDIFPNPASDAATIRYAISARTRVELLFYDLRGRRIALLVDEPQVPGRYRATAELGSLPNGIYVLRLWANGSISTRQLLVMR